MKRLWRCRIGLHRWTPHFFEDWCWRWCWPNGRRCVRCGRVQCRDPYYFWETLPDKAE